MSKAISKRSLRELIEAAGRHCDHPEGDHEPGYCDYVTVSQEDLMALFDEASA